MHRYCAVHALILCIVWLYGSGYGQVAIAQQSAADDVIRVGITRDLPPLHYMNGDGEPAGLDIDLMDAIAARANWTPVYEFDRREVILQKLAAGEIDVAPMSSTEERHDKALFATPYLYLNHYLYGRSDARPVNSLQEIHGSSVAVEHHSHAWHELQRDGGAGQPVTVQSETDAVRLLADGLVDYALVKDAVAKSVIEREHFDNIIPLSPPLLPGNYGLAVSPARSELVGRINTVEEELRRAGVIDRLRTQWLGDTAGFRESIMNISWLIALMIVGLGFAGYQLWRRRYQLRYLTNLANTAEQRRLEAESNAEKMATYDELTGLPRNTFFRNYLHQAIEHARETDRTMAVAMLKLLDIDTIRQVAGYPVSEGLLRLEADALDAEHIGFIAHLGAGRFGFIFEEFQDRSEIMDKLHSLRIIASQQYEVDEVPLEPRVACGIAMFPEHGYSEAQLYRSAELAMLKAEEKHQAILAYEPSMEPDARNLSLISDMKKAISLNAFDWVYQPKFSLRHNRIIGAEMLIRWRHPRYGDLSPAIFIPLAEKTGLIGMLTRLVVQQASDIIHRWREMRECWTLSINVSGNDLADRELIETIIENLDDSVKGMLMLEVTETAIMEDVEVISSNIKKLEKAGVMIALDDYGTGYSSLSYLQQLKFDEIKIDMAFIRNMLNSEKDMKITKASINLGHELNVLMTAEGVEDDKTATELNKMGCDVLQGFGIAKPMVLAEFESFASTYKASRETRTQENV